MALKTLFFKSIAVDVAVANQSESKADIGVNALEGGDESRGAVVRKCVVKLRFCEEFITAL